MKGIHLIAFLASFTVIIASKLPDIFEAENECPAVDTCPPKLISHETNCAQYYECKNGQKQLRACAAGLYFSKIWRGCVNWDISDCPNTPTPGPTPTPTPKPDPSPDCKKDGDLVKHECQCEKFYECKSGWKALRECPAGEVFIPEKSSCRPGYKDKDGNCRENGPDPDCTGNERKPHECQCEKYYECLNGYWALRECPQGWHYDNTTEGCIQGPCHPDPRECIEKDKKYHECCCDKYYTCINGDWVTEDCEDGNHFSNSSKACVNPRDAHCTNYVLGDCSRNCIKTWKHECDCRLWYECVNGKKVEHGCVWGNYWNKATLRCDVKGNVACKNSWD